MRYRSEHEHNCYNMVATNRAGPQIVTKYNSCNIKTVIPAQCTINKPSNEIKNRMTLTNQAWPQQQ